MKCVIKEEIDLMRHELKEINFIAVIDCVTRALRPSFTPFSINAITEVAVVRGERLNFFAPN